MLFRRVLRTGVEGGLLSLEARVLTGVADKSTLFLLLRLRAEEGVFVIPSTLETSAIAFDVSDTLFSVSNILWTETEFVFVISDLFRTSAYF